MDTPSSSTRKLAQRLLELEAPGRSASKEPGSQAARVCDKLRLALARVAGEEGFRSLLRRALTLARAEIPSLRSVQLSPDCSLEGLKQLGAESGGGEPEVDRATLAMVAHLLHLLVTFIGQPITVRLLREAWPDASLED